MNQCQTHQWPRWLPDSWRCRPAAALRGWRGGHSPGAAPHSGRQDCGKTGCCCCGCCCWNPRLLFGAAGSRRSQHRISNYFSLKEDIRRWTPKTLPPLRAAFSELPAKNVLYSTLWKTEPCNYGGFAITNSSPSLQSTAVLFSSSRSISRDVVQMNPMYLSLTSQGSFFAKEGNACW